MVNDGNSLHTPSPLSAEPPLFLEGNIRTYSFIGDAPPVFVPMYRGSATLLKEGVRGIIGTPRQPVGQKGKDEGPAGQPDISLAGNDTIELRSKINHEHYEDFGVIVA